jgi:hypothetical protein
MLDALQIVLVIHRKNLELPKKPKEPKAEDYEDFALFEEARTKYETRFAKYEKKYVEVKQNWDWFKWYWLAGSVSPILPPCLGRSTPPSSSTNRPSTSFIRALTPIPRPGQSGGEDGVQMDGNVFWS